MDAPWYFWARILIWVIPATRKGAGPAKVTSRLVKVAPNGGTSWIAWTSAAIFLKLLDRAVPVDANTAQVTGEIFPLAANGSIAPGAAGFPVTTSENGMLLFATGTNVSQRSRMVWFDRAGKSQPIEIPTSDPVVTPALSLDGKELAYSRVGTIFIRYLARGTDVRFGDATDQTGIEPFWSPDGSRFAYMVRPMMVHVRPVNGGQDEPLLRDDPRARPYKWSRDGKYIVYPTEDEKTRRDLWVMPMDKPEGSPTSKNSKLRPDPGLAATSVRMT